MTHVSDSDSLLDRENAVQHACSPLFAEEVSLASSLRWETCVLPHKYLITLTMARNQYFLKALLAFALLATGGAFSFPRFVSPTSSCVIPRDDLFYLTQRLSRQPVTVSPRSLGRPRVSVSKPAFSLASNTQSLASSILQKQPNVAVPTKHSKRQVAKKVSNSCQDDRHSRRNDPRSHCPRHPPSHNHMLVCMSP